MAPDSPQLIQLMGDIRRPLALEVGAVDVPDDIRLLGDDLQFPPCQPVAVGSGGGTKIPFSIRIRTLTLILLEWLVDSIWEKAP